MMEIFREMNYLRPSRSGLKLDLQLALLAETAEGEIASGARSGLCAMSRITVSLAEPGETRTSPDVNPSPLPPPPEPDGAGTSL